MAPLQSTHMSQMPPTSQTKALVLKLMHALDAAAEQAQDLEEQATDSREAAAAAHRASTAAAGEGLRRRQCLRRCPAAPRRQPSAASHRPSCLPLALSLQGGTEEGQLRANI